jgi:thiosulfate reductase cytochrome b subunit
MKKTTSKLLVAGLLLVAAALAGAGIRLVAARSLEVRPEAASPLHPTFALLDYAGANVLQSGNPVSTMQTCGQCHDTDFIASHSFHADLGLSDLQAGQASTGLFGGWDPLTYRYLSNPGDSRLDLGTAGWIMFNAGRFVGGGPGVTSRDGKPLTGLAADASNPETAVLNTKTGEAAAWDWKQSGALEMDCFVCHLPQPDNTARVATIQAGQFAWAGTATLNGTGLVSKTADGWTWNAAAFDGNGEILPEYVTLQDPSNDNCAQCHGLAHSDPKTPLTLPACNDLDYSQTATTGQVIVPEKISESGVNLANKDSLSRSWDIHAERGLQCVDCHFSLNNPALYQESQATRPETLLFDPRRIDLGEYLKNPNHNFARGQSAQYNVAPELKGTMRRCESCHDAGKIHANWLPYTERHMQVVACETCHVPQLYAPAIQSYDWTVVHLDGQPNVACRGVDGLGGNSTDLISGYQPVLLQRTNVDGGTALAPYNLVTTWYWVYDDHGRTLPVRLADLEAAFVEKGRYAPAIVSAFDADGSGTLEAAELVIDTVAKQQAVAARLAGFGLENPRIAGQVQPYSINHNVAGADWAVSDCKSCHTTDSRLTQPIELAAQVPGGVLPTFVSDTNVPQDGQIVRADDGSLVYQPSTKEEGRYVFGQSRVAWVDWFGGLFFLAVLAAVGGHSGLRIYNAARHPKPAATIKKVLMYQAYERLWHWLQTVVIVLLLLTGLVIHRPDLFGIFSFRGMVTMHNVLWVILAINAALSLFYHLASGQIRQFIPRPRGFFDDAILQAKYYLGGIFKHEPHPFEKTPERKMNPLQQVTYVAILNVLLPLQGLTGILMWGAQQWPSIAAKLGGLPFLAPFHTLIAWTFAAFIVGHVYLTTTGGPKPLDSINAMITGWEDVETHETGSAPESGSKPKAASKSSTGKEKK